MNIRIASVALAVTVLAALLWNFATSAEVRTNETPSPTEPALLQSGTAFLTEPAAKPDLERLNALEIIAGSKSVVSPPPVPTQQTNKPDSRTLWADIESVSASLFDGTADFEDVGRISKSLLSHFDETSGVRRSDGAVEYKLQSDPELGSATLIVNPNRAGTVEQYELVVEKTTASGYTGPSADVTGSRMRITYGDSGDGTWGFGAHVEDRLKRDANMWAANEHAGPLDLGGKLSSQGPDVYWIRDVTEAIRMPIGGEGWSQGYDRKSRKLVSKDGLASTTMSDIRSMLAAHGPK